MRVCDPLPTKKGTLSMGHSKRLGAPEGEEHDGEDEAQRRKKEPRNPGSRFHSFIKLPPSTRRLPSMRLKFPRSPFTPCVSPSTEAYALMVGGQTCWGEMRLLAVYGFQFFLPSLTLITTSFHRWAQMPGTHKVHMKCRMKHISLQKEFCNKRQFSFKWHFNFFFFELGLERRPSYKA